MSVRFCKSKHNCYTRNPSLVSKSEFGVNQVFTHFLKFLPLCVLQRLVGSSSAARHVCPNISVTCLPSSHSSCTGNLSRDSSQGSGYLNKIVKAVQFHEATSRSETALFLIPLRTASESQARKAAVCRRKPPAPTHPFTRSGRDSGD